MARKKQVQGGVAKKSGPVTKPPVIKEMPTEVKVPEPVKSNYVAKRPEPKPETVFEAPAHKLPAGWVWVWNRLGREWEHPFDGKPIIFEPYEFKPVTEEIADFLYAHCIISYDANSPDGVIRCLAVDEDEGWCIPLDEPEERVELIDRTEDDNPVGWGTGGEETKPVVMKVPGAKQERYRGGASWGRTSSKAIRGKR